MDADKQEDIILKNTHDVQISLDSKSVTAFFLIFGFFVSSLIVNMVVAAKLVAFGPLIVPASVFIWALTYPVSDIVTELYGPRMAKRLLLGGFVGLVTMFLVFHLAVILPPAPFWEGQEQFAKFVGISYRVTAAVLISYVSTQFLDVYVFTKIKERTGDKHLWLRSAGSTIVAQTLANVIFTTIVFAGVLEWNNWWSLFWGNLTMRYILVISDTIIVYAVVFYFRKFFPDLRKGF
jgi:uncharacterized integral membrane protein (TIGR00697 family)